MRVNDVAIICRVKAIGVYRGAVAGNGRELEPIVPRDGLKSCQKHHRTLWFEGQSCPCCEIEEAWVRPGRAAKEAIR